MSRPPEPVSRRPPASRASAGRPRPSPWRPGLAILLTLCVAAITDDASAATSTLRRGAYGEPESLVPRESGVASEQVILRDLFEGLATFGPAGEVRPGAAESWQVSPDGRTYTFRLRPGLQWSDGQPLTAADFAWGWRHSLDPRNAVARATRLYVIRHAQSIHAGRAPPSRLGVATPDARTLVVELEYPLPSLPVLFAGEEGFPLPRHALERHGDGWTRPGNHVGNGAFGLAARRARGAILLRRNPRFHAAKEVALEAVEYLPSDDLQSLVARFRAGGLEVNGWPGFPARQGEALRRELGAQVRVGPLQSVRYLRFNVARPPFDDLRVRRALSLAVDREVLVRRVLGGGERVSLRAVPDGLPGDRAPTDNPLAAATQAARTAAARAALAAAPVRGRLPPQIRLRVPAGNGEELCVAISAMWTAAGAPARPERSEIKSLIADLRRGDFDVALTGAQDTPATESYLERFRPDSSYNTGRWNAPAFVSALDAALRLPDADARSSGMLAAERVLMHDHAIVPLYQEVARNLVSARVGGWVDNAGDIHLSRYLSLQ